MKKINKVLVLLMVSILIYSCTTQENELEMLQQEPSNLNSKTAVQLRRNYSANTLVVRFKPNATETTKKTIRDHFGVQSYELCDNCSDDLIELWTFNSTIQIEPKKETIDSPDGLVWRTIVNDNIYAVDFNYVLKVMPKTNTLNNIDGVNNNTSSSKVSTLSYQSYIKPTNNGVSIGVFDTGINPMVVENALPVFPSPFLYNAANDGIPAIETGWDFVNKDNDAFEDNTAAHGTIITSIVTRSLNNFPAIPHQIMPLKIADANGMITYFHLVCSLNYALERNISVIQMSLGWYSNSPDMNSTIFESLLNDYPTATVITSAGNDANNNDSNKHWPSCFPSNQIIAVASCNQNGIISSWSNFGKVTVDYVAKGENISFSGLPIQGTSYATPVVTARVARIKSTNPTISPAALILAINSTGNSFNTPNLIKHNKIIF